MMVKNGKWKLWAALFLVLPLFFATLQARAAEVPGGHSGQVSPDGGEYADPEDIDLRLEYAGFLTDEQMAALEEAYALLKEGVSAAEDAYREAIKSLKDRYRTAAQDAVKSIADEAALAAFLEGLTEEILVGYEAVQKALDEGVSVARLGFAQAADAALIPEDIIDRLIVWHENKELNLADELIRFLDSYKNLSGQGNSGEAQGQGIGNQHKTLTQNGEQNGEENQNQGEQQNQEQEKQQEQNDQGNANQGSRSGQQNAQPQGGPSGGKGKGGN